MKSLDFVQLKYDYCIFKKEDPLVFIALYVDDIIPISQNMNIMNSVKADIAKTFSR